MLCILVARLVQARVISVLEFPWEGCNIRKVFGYKSIFQNETCILWTGVGASCQKVQKSDFQSHFSMSKMIWIFPIFFTEKYQFLHTFFYWYFSRTLFYIFIRLYLLKWFQFFDDSLLHQFTKYNNLLFRQKPI